MPNEYGDYQTPLSLANKVTKLLNDNSINYSNIIEPTFGTGSFIISAYRNIKHIKSISGVELNKRHFKKALLRIHKVMPKYISLNLQHKNIFTIKLQSLFKSKEHNLVIGNLPWVTVSQLSSMNSKNVPKKYNIKGLTGYDALTGKSNFDVSEYITLMLMNEMSTLGKSSTLALLVKDSVCQDILKYLPQSNLYPSSFNAYLINAKKEFDANVDACLMIIDFPGTKSKKTNNFNDKVNVYTLNRPRNLEYTFGWVGPHFTSNVRNYIKFSKFDDVTSWNWRSGIKHDASKVMNFTKCNNKYFNGLHEQVSIENNLVYPLIKSSEVRKAKIHTKYSKYMLVTQHKIGQNTKYIEAQYPRTWKYLQCHKKYFLRRKSSIYRNSDIFSIFGVGNYSFKPYKVAVSGMYKIPFFSILSPLNGKPVMTDDTVYFVGFNKLYNAIIFAAIMNSNIVQDLLKSLVFESSKRPYTKDILKRVNVMAIIKDVTLNYLNNYAFKRISQSDLTKFKHTFANKYAKTYENISLF